MTNGGGSSVLTGGCRSWNASETGPDSVEAYRACQHPNLERAFLKKCGVTLMVGRCLAGGRKLWLGAPEQPYRAVSARGIEYSNAGGLIRNPVELSFLRIEPSVYSSWSLQIPPPPPMAGSTRLKS